MLPAIAIAFLLKLLQSEHCINAINCINNHKMLRIFYSGILLFHINGSPGNWGIAGDPKRTGAQEAQYVNQATEMIVHFDIILQ